MCVHLCLWGGGRYRSAVAGVWVDVEACCCCAVWQLVLGAMCPQPVHLHGWGEGAVWVGLLHVWVMLGVAQELRTTYAWLRAFQQEMHAQHPALAEPEQ